MKRQISYDENPKIYLVPTPIGNIEDITLRSIRILKEVSRVYAEDTRNSQFLLRHYDIKTPLFPYHLFNEQEASKAIIKYLLETKADIALISDAGQPLISDPGLNLIKLAQENDINVISLPGPNAFSTAFCASGLATPFLFIGFLEATSLKRQNQLKELLHLPYTLIFYEAPHRLKKFLSDLKAIFTDRKIVIAREISKLHEEYTFFQIDEEIDLNLKGEFVVLVSGFKEENVTLTYEEALELVAKAVKKGGKLTDICKEIAQTYRLDRKLLYKKYLDK